MKRSSSGEVPARYSLSPTFHKRKQQERGKEECDVKYARIAAVVQGAIGIYGTATRGVGRFVARQ